MTERVAARMMAAPSGAPAVAIDVRAASGLSVVGNEAGHNPKVFVRTIQAVDNGGAGRRDSC